MQKQPSIPTVHHRNTKTHEASGAIAQVMGDPIALQNSIGAKQRRGDLTVSRVVETAIKGAQGEDEPVSATLTSNSPSNGRRTAAGCTPPLSR